MKKISDDAKHGVGKYIFLSLKIFVLDGLSLGPYTVWIVGSDARSILARFTKLQAIWCCSSVHSNELKFGLHHFLCFFHKTA